MSILVIFHSINGKMHCDDGFASACVAKMAMPGEDIEFHPGIYGQPAPIGKANGRFVYVLDFSYSREQMVQLGRAAERLVVIDHHKTAQENLEGLADEIMSDGWRGIRNDGFGHPINAPYVLFDMNHSACILTWQFFFRNALGAEWKVPELLKRIEDGDLWRWNFPNSKFVQAALRSYPQEFDLWIEMFKWPISRLQSEGISIRRFIEAKIRELLPNARRAILDGHPTWTIACPKFLASELAGALVEHTGTDFAVAYEDGYDQRTYSLRSRGDFDVSTIAKKFGGGGHKNAAGFQVPLP